MATAPPTITALPTPPDPNDRSTFNAKAYPWSVAQQTLANEVGAVAANVYANAAEAAAAASTATTKAGEAGTSATNAAASAATATTKAGEANASASSASSSASTATTQAVIAAAKAAEAAASAASIAGGPVANVNGKTGAVTLAKSDVGLANVDNTTDTAKPISTAQQAALDLKASSATPTITGLREVKVAMAANDINLATGNIFTKTITAISTLTVSNVPAAGTAATFILDLTNGGAFAITWWSGVKWAGGTAPTLTAAGRDVLGFYTHDGGTTWTGLVLGKDVK